MRQRGASAKTNAHASPSRSHASPSREPVDRRGHGSGTEAAGSSTELDGQLVREFEALRAAFDEQREQLRLARQQLAELRGRGADLGDPATACSVTVDGRGVIREISLAVAQLLGEGHSRLVGTRFGRYVARGHKRKFKKYVEGCLRGERLTLPGMLTDIRGRTFAVELCGCLVKPAGQGVVLCRIAIEADLDRAGGAVPTRDVGDDGGQVLDAVPTMGMIVDAKCRIADVNQVLADRLGETNFRVLVEHTEDIPYIITPQGIITYIGPQAERYGFSPAAVLAHSFRRMVLPRDRDCVARNLARVLATDETLASEFRILDKDGQVRWFEDRGTVQRDSGGKAIAVSGFLREITDRKELQRKLAELAVDERARIGRDLHDSLGQELTGLGFVAERLRSDLLNQASAEVEQATRVVRGIERAADQMHSIVEKLVPIQLKTGDLACALQRLADEMNEVGGVRCHFCCPQPIVFIEPAVATRMYRIAQEAVNNAAKHARAKTVTIAVGSDARGIALDVRDDGVGIPDASDRREGMGLEIMAYRAALIGAELRVERAEAGGTLVHCRLPREERDAKSREKPGSES